MKRSVPKEREGGSEEEVDNEDGREGESEQMSDSQQNRLASVVNGGEDGDQGSPGEVDDGELGHKRNQELEKTEAFDTEGESGIDS